MRKLECPKCKGTKLRVENTQAKLEGVARLRICVGCGLRIETMEYIESVHEKSTAGVHAKKLTVRKKYKP